VPFAILWFGVTPAAAVFIIAIGVFWINLFAAVAAVQSVDRDLLELGDAFGRRSRLSKLLPIVLPAAAPGILAGLRTGIGQAWMAVVAAEIFGVAGIGQRMMQAASLIATDVVVVCMLTMAILYGIMDALFLRLQARVLAWQG
jgi:NitT/TauT family transport system permease protein